VSTQLQLTNKYIIYEAVRFNSVHSAISVDGFWVAGFEIYICEDLSFWTLLLPCLGMETERKRETGNGTWKSDIRELDKLVCHNRSSDKLCGR
jgi:hypothetical protein